MAIPLIATLVGVASKGGKAKKSQRMAGVPGVRRKRGPGTSDARGAVVPRKRGGKHSGPPVSAEVLAALPTMKLLDMLNAAADDPEAAPGLDVSGAVSQGLDWLSDALGAREAQIVAGIRASLGGLDGQGKRRALMELRDRAMHEVQTVAGQLEQYNSGRTAPAQRAGMAARIGAAAESLHVFALEAAGRQADFMGGIVEMVAQRAANAAEIVANGAGNAFEAFWGVRPGTAIGAVGLGAIALVAIGAFLLLSPGGQAFLISYGKGFAAAGTGAGKLFAKGGVAAVKLAT